MTESLETANQKKGAMMNMTRATKPPSTKPSEEEKTAFENCFRELRSEWFNAHLFHERQWETEEEEAERESRNAIYRMVYDKHTEAIICGEVRPIAPRCENDLQKIT